MPHWFQIAVSASLFFSIQITAERQLHFNTLCHLSQKAKEISGLAFYQDKLWMINDGENGPDLYALSLKDCHIEKKIQFKNAKNVDWEALTQDKNAFYIGDIGNNDGTRKDLVIYKILKKDIQADLKKQTVSSEKIYIQYPDQTTFIPEANQTNFDAEALAADDNQLYVFTKHWKDAKTTVYAFPKVPGHYVGQKIMTLDHVNLVTDALIENQTLWLLSYEIFLYVKPTLYQYDWPLNGNTKRTAFSLNFWGQAEGLAFSPSGMMYMGREALWPTEAAIFQRQLSD